MVYTVSWFGIDRTASPWSLGVYDANNTPQNFLKVPATGGGVYVPASAGGTGQTSLTANGVLIGEGTNAVNSVATATAGQLLISQTSGSDPAWETASGDWTIAANGAATLATVNSNVGSFGSSTAIPNFTVNGKGLVTAAGTSVVVAPAGTLTGTTLATNVVNSSLTSVGIIVSGSFPAANLTGTTLAANVVNASLTTLSSLTTVGTIGTGVWQGTPVALAFGGTNANLTANVGGIFYSTASAAAILAGTPTARQMLQSGSSGAPAWSTAVWPATTTINQLLYSSAANTVAGLATANGGVLNTSATGVPSVTNAPVLGLNGSAGGSLTLNGATSGSALLGVPSVAGSAVPFNFPTMLGSNGNVLTTDGAGNYSPQPASGGGNSPPQGRLTLTTATPVLTGAVSASANVLYTPYVGSNIPLWSGSAFVSTVFTELTNVLANSAVGNAGPEAAVASSVYDLFAWNNAGTPTLSRGPNWGVVSPQYGKTATITAPNATPGVVTWTAHGFSANQGVTFTATSGTLPTVLQSSASVNVLAAGLAANTFEVGTGNPGGSASAFSGSTAGSFTGFATLYMPSGGTAIYQPGLTMSNGQQVVFSGSGTLPVALTKGTIYFVVSAAAGSFSVSATLGGSAITFAAAATGVINVALANATARQSAAAISFANGVWTNTNAIVNGPAAGFGTYVGTVKTDASGATVSWNPGGAASGGTAAVLNVWNTYNRVSVGAAVTDNGTAYTYTTATNRQARASAGNQISFVLGLQEDTVEARITGAAKTAAALAGTAQFGLGFDTLTAFSVQPAVIDAPTAAAYTSGGSVSALWNAGIGVHVLSSQEIGDGTNANTFDNSSLNILSATLRM